jgi:hypothetical protein
MPNGDEAAYVAMVVSVLSVLGMLIWLVDAVLKGCLRILKRSERAWRVAAKRIQERLAEGAREHQRLAAARERARQQEEQASASPALVDAVMHGDPPDKKRKSYQNNFIVALCEIIVSLVIVILRSPKQNCAA